LRLPIRWSKRANADLRDVIDFIRREDPVAAQSIRDRIQAAISPIADHPYLYRSGRVPGTREIVAHPNYVVVYRVWDDRVEITNVIHAQRRYP
jgi:toxin ParE1/3/4